MSAEKMWVKLNARNPQRSVGKWIADIEIDKKLLDKLYKMLQGKEETHGKSKG